DRRAEADARSAECRRVDDLGARKLVLDVLDASLEQTLALLGGVILGVFAEVAVLARDPDVTGSLGPFLLQPPELLAQLLSALWRHRYLGVGHPSSGLPSAPKPRAGRR